MSILDQYYNYNDETTVHRYCKLVSITADIPKCQWTQVRFCVHLFFVPPLPPPPGTFKESIIKKNSFCIVHYCKHTGVGNTINTGFHIGVLRGEMEGVGTSLCFARHGYMMRQL